MSLFSSSDSLPREGRLEKGFKGNPIFPNHKRNKGFIACVRAQIVDLYQKSAKKCKKIPQTIAGFPNWLYLCIVKRLIDCLG
jgi:hypothetical protein